MEQRKHSSSAARLAPQSEPPQPARPEHVRRFGFEWALLPHGWARDVVLSVSEQGLISHVASGVGTGARTESKTRGSDPGDRGSAAEPEGVQWTRASVVPGMPNVHSHAHQRFMAGLAERSGPLSSEKTDTFWTWREVMYAFAGKLNPEQLEAAAAMAYVEMLEAGFTAVGEFQYLHNQPNGSFYDERAEMSLRCLEAARLTGIAITLLPVLYSQGGFDGRALAGGQLRFATGVDGVLKIVDCLRAAVDSAQGPETRRDRERVGIAPHSLRAVSEAELVAVTREVRAIDAAAPIHMHISEQTAEVQDCLHATGRRPVEYLLEQMDAAGLPVDASWCLIHATHLSRKECLDLAASRAVVGLCPTTEANLGDGIFSGKQFLLGSGKDDLSAEGSAPGRLGIGTDSQVRISVIEDLRQLETSQRLTHHQRNVLAGDADTSTGRILYCASALGGAQALNQPMGALEVGQRADFVVLDSEHARLLERTEDALLDSWIFAGDSRCVLDVYVGGERVVEGGRHVRRDTVVRDYRRAVQELQI